MGINAKYKRLPNIFIMLNRVGDSTIMYSFFISSMEETIRKGQYDFCLTEVFTAHLLKKNQDGVICLYRDIRKTISCLIQWNPYSRRNEK